MPAAALLPHMLSPTPEHLKTFFGTAEDVVVYATGYETGFDDIRTVKDDEEARTNGIPTDGSMLQVPPLTQLVSCCHSSSPGCYNVHE